jgi:hypothetical protein
VFLLRKVSSVRKTREHDHRYVMAPALPVATVIVIQAEFFFELVIVLLDSAAALDKPHDPPQQGAGREIAQPVLGRARARDYVMVFFEE